jgi:Flp pilus assembly protein TadD
VEQLQEAIRICEECPARADLHKNIGLIYARSGDLEKARQELLAARKLKPADADIEKALAILQGLEEPASPGRQP